jgi:hypothetical protein
MFTSGRIAFIIFFVISFFVLLMWSYRKDARVNKIHYKGIFWIFFSIVAVFSILFLIVKFHH